MGWIILVYLADLEVIEVFKYPKIKTLFVRDKKTFKVIPELKVTSFDNVKNIIAQEKVDGTNAQILLQYDYIYGLNYRIFSRNSELTSGEVKDVMFIRETLSKNIEIFRALKGWYLEQFIAYRKTPTTPETKYPEVKIFLEVYGDKINKGGIYCAKNTRKFRVFDIMIGEHFSSFYRVKEICDKVGLKTVPILYEGKINDWLDYYQLERRLAIGKWTKNNYDSGYCQTGVKENGTGGYLEGYIIRSEPLLLTEYGERILAKIKRNDFLKGVK